MGRNFLSRVVALTLSVVLAAALVPAQALAAWPTNPVRLSLNAERVAGQNRYAVAAQMAQRAYPNWSGITDVVIASGDDRAAADPLSAAGLCWAYDAPLLLTSATFTPVETRAALSAIRSANTTVTVHVVGGSASVPSARVNELKAIVGSKGSVVQSWATGDRYALAAGIADRMRQVATETSKTAPAAVFVANGQEASRFWDALAASAITRHRGVPVLLVGAQTVPRSTERALARMGSVDTIVIGGTQSVSPAVYSAVSADRRWSGQNRYSTATAVARQAVSRGWSDGTRVALAAKLPDALAGAASIGRSGGIVLLTDSVRLPKDTWSRLTGAPAISRCTVLGGEQSVSRALFNELRGAPGMPTMSKGMPAATVGKSMRVAGKVNSNTTRVTLFVAGKQIAHRDVSNYGSYDFGTVTSPANSGTVEVRASNPDNKTCSVTRKVTRVIYPYPTCIIVDKSEFKLYWIKDNQLVKTYPVAIGRSNAETPVATWKILSKYHTDPGSVYGPRKMRMYRQSGSSFVYTAYNIHGTNNPASIGTKASAGCIRMYNSDVLELFPQVPIGTMVITRP